MGTPYRDTNYFQEDVADLQTALDMTMGVAITGIRQDTPFDVCWELADKRLIAMKRLPAFCPACGLAPLTPSWSVLTPWTHPTLHAGQCQCGHPVAAHFKGVGPCWIEWCDCRKPVT